MKETNYTQADLDETMVSIGRDKYRARLAKAVKKGRETDTKPVKRLLISGVASLSDALEAWLANEANKGKRGKVNNIAKALDSLDVDSVAYIAVQTVLDQLSQPRNYLTVAYRIARSIEEEAQFALLEKSKPHAWKDIIKERDRYTSSAARGRRVEALWKIIGNHHDDVLGEWDPWERRTCYRVGTLLIELMAQNTGIVSVDQVPAYKRGVPGAKKAVIMPTAECVEWLTSKHAESELLLPYYLPMVVEPTPWTSQTSGGYAMNGGAFPALFRVQRKSLEGMTPEAMPRVYETVNHVQRTEWAINEPVRQVAEYVWRELGGGIAGLPSLEKEEMVNKPTKEQFAEGGPMVKEWKRNAAMMHVRNRSTMSQRLLVAKVLKEAEAFSRQPIWYPHKYDFRGRIYPIAVSGLSPQGADLSKGLLKFAEGREIKTKEGHDWFHIHGANAWGADKVPFADRVEWVKQNKAMVLACADDPLGNVEWCGASHPFQFLAWCFDFSEYTEALEKGTVHLSTTPVAMDGSNNGLQLYSLLTRDETCAKATNVSPGDKPEDIYDMVAVGVTEHLQSIAFKGTGCDWAGAKLTEEEATEYARNWLAFLGGTATRDMTKRPVMVLPYGGTLYSCREYVDEWFSGELRTRGLINDRPFAHAYKHVLLLARIVWASIDGLVTAPTQMMHWLREVAAIHADAGIPIKWTTPSGFPIVQSTYTTNTSRIKLRIGGTLVRRTAQVPTSTLSKPKQKNGVAPNFVHGLDAALMSAAVLKCKAAGVRDIAVVHDSFAVHADNCATLATALRESAYEIFSEDVIGGFKTECEAALGFALPAPPLLGSLNVECVLQSNYLYS